MAPDVKWHEVYGDLINSTHRAMRRGSMDIQGAKDGLRRLLLERSADGGKLWERFIIVAGDGSVLEDTTENPLSSFREFIESEPLRGLGQKVADVERLISDDAEALAALRDELVASKGNPTGANQHRGNSNNITISNSQLDLLKEPEPKQKQKTERGTGKAYTLSRLKKNDPELFDEVKAGKISANAAALKAGYRKPARSIPIDSPESAIKALLRIFSSDDLVRAIGVIADGQNA